MNCRGLASLIGSLLTLHPALAPPAPACTRVVYLGPENTVITVRSMDWKTDMGTNLWIFPRGMQRDGAAGPKSIRWTSRYGSVISAVFEAGTGDGMNERGLVANLLYLVESDYVPSGSAGRRLPLCISAWAQYVLDNYATVAEAVADARKEPYYAVSTTSPDGAAGTVHLSISDPTGDSAIFEYIQGKLVIHHGRQYQVMTNSPAYDRQLALNEYWKQIGGTIMLPGTNRAADRFARASFYINAIPKTADERESVASAFSVIRNCSVPLGITTPDQPNISSTIWRTVADHKHRKYYFESARSPNVFWVSLEKIDFSAGQYAKRLKLSGGEVYAGDATASFVQTSPFKFLPADAK